MYKEIALDPACMSEYHYYGLLKTSFGFEKGRYVIAPTRDWAREAFQAVKASAISPVKKKSVTRFLNIIQKSRTSEFVYLPKHRAEITADSWSDWCTKQHAYYPFNSVISEQFNNAINYDDVLSEHNSWVIPPSMRINKTAEDISNSLIALLKLGGDLTIVDQYFCLANNAVLQAIMALIQDCKSITSITLVTSINTVQPETVFNHEYLASFNYIPRFSLVVAPERFFHDRYVISDKGAIKSGHGFSEAIAQGVQADMLSISLCGKEESDVTRGWISKALSEGKANLLVLKE